MIKIRHANRQRKLAKRNFPALTRREVEVMEFLCKGKVHKEIGKELHRSEKTVHKHVQNISKRYGVNKETALVAKYQVQKYGILEF